MPAAWTPRCQLSSASRLSFTGSVGKALDPIAADSISILSRYSSSVFGLVFSNAVNSLKPGKASRLEPVRDMIEHIEETLSG